MSASIPTSSPRKAGIGGLETFSSHHHSESRQAIKQELVGKLGFDDERVLQRLRVDDVKQSLVDTCSVTFDSDNNGSITKLKALEKAATKSKGISSQRREPEMYDPLYQIFQYINKRAGATTNRPEGPRKFQPQGDHALLSEDTHTIGFPEEKPDFSLLRTTDVQTQQWCDRDGFCEVKPTKGQGPKPSPGHDSVVNDLIAQTADYARLHMSSRPFLLFSVGLLIFGSDFCVAICDRDGMTFSPVKNMWDDTKDFIRIVISMTTILSDVELGQDPTVEKLPSQVSKAINKCTYPSYVISYVGDDVRRWCTVGSPMWSSLSLLGRGTTVWRVREYAENTLLDSSTEKVLKTAWRHPNRTPEAKIYEAIQGTPPGGLAEFLTGGDVSVGNHLITVSFLRTGHNSNDDMSPILHRVLLNTVGRPLWEYSSDIELLKAIRAATLAHKFLWDQGILHRDISAGNILLAKDFNAAPKGAEGFLTDLEFAGLPSEIHKVEQVPPLKKTRYAYTEATTRTKTTFYDHKGAVISGTLLFMAEELLGSIVSKSQIKQTLEHDVESIIIVFVYTALRNLLRTAPDKEERTAIMKSFKRAFSHTSVVGIVDSRTAVFDWIDEPFTERLPSSLLDLFNDFRARLLQRQTAWKTAKTATRYKSRTDYRVNPLVLKSLESSPLDHGYLIDMLDFAIGTLEDMNDAT